ncbi:energy transducer TonB [Luteimonas sp. A482]
MSDPTREPPAPPPPPQPDDAAQARRRSPLPWILLLLAIILAAWYFISRGDAPLDSTPTIGETTPLPSESPVSAPPATRERPAPERVRPATSADRVAAPIDQPQPEYPAAALRAGEQGTVVLRVDVGADGKPTDVQVAERSRSRELDRAAQRAVRDWTFQPAMRNGKPVASVVQVPVDFTIDTP